MPKFDLKQMLSLAYEQTAHCRLVKSTTRVGCCIYTTEGKYYGGCNFDSEFGVTHHAETSAITNMVIHGVEWEKVAAVYIYCTRKHFTPCGACRDHIRFFAVENALVFIDNGEEVFKYTINDLTPVYPER